MTEIAPESYKLSIPCKRDERETLEEQVEDMLMPFAMASFEATPDGENWRVEGWFHEEPSAATCANLFGDFDWSIEPVMPENWVKKSLRPLDPVIAGRFYVYGSHDGPGAAPHSKIPLKIDAGMAFGTGHHETTAGCLDAISILAKSVRPCNILDLGCGTGLLGIAAGKIWRDASLALSDIDPDATEFTRDALRDNGLNARPDTAVITADGMTHPALSARAPYDLIIANILAAPLVRLAPSIVGALASGSQSHLILSGLLVKQEQMVASAYRPFGLSVKHRIRRGEWSALVLSRP